MTEDIVQETKSGIGIGYHTEGRLVDQDRSSHGRYVVCKVFKFLPETSEHGKRFLDEQRLKALCSIRDPRDIAVSMRKRSEGRGKEGKPSAWSFHTTIQDNFPIWLGQLTQWIDLGPEISMVSRFEEFTQNLFRETRRIADHLQIDLDKSLAHKIARKYSIKAQMDRAKKLREDNRTRKDKKQATERAHPKLPSIPGIVFGASGIYHTWLTLPEAQLVYEFNKEFMNRFGYK
jgi:hypothetical protein